MKIQKFNENTRGTEYYHCMIILQNSIEEHGIFESEESMNNWIVNYINLNIIPLYKNDIEQNFLDMNISNVYKDENGNLVCVSANDGIAFLTEFDDDGYNFFIEKSNIMNVDVPANVKLLRQQTEYNI